MKTETKRFPGRLEFKADGAREFKAIFATLAPVIDHDGDRTFPGAFEEGKEVLVGSYGHKLHDLPVGSGVMHSDNAEAWIEGSFAGTATATETYETLKDLGHLIEWSYTFVPTKFAYVEEDGRQIRDLYENDVFTVDPVVKGAGIDTGLVSIKALKGLGFGEFMDEIVLIIDEFHGRVSDRAGLLAKEGRTLSVANVEKLGTMATTLRVSAGDLENFVMAAADPKSGDEDIDAKLEAELLRFETLRARFQNT